MTPTFIALWVIGDYLIGSVRSGGNQSDTSWAQIGLLIGLITIGGAASIYKRQSLPMSLAIRIHRLLGYLHKTTR